jgi:hypothetical protein
MGFRARISWHQRNREGESYLRGCPRVTAVAHYGEGARVGAVLDAMREQSRPIKPRDLGIISEAHLRAKFESAGAAPESFSYKRSEIEYDGVPYLAEAAFGYPTRGPSRARQSSRWRPRS